jgi:hypothetical protein
MKNHFRHSFKRVAVIVTALLCCTASTRAAQSPKAAAKPAVTNLPPAIILEPAVQSLFKEPANPKEGRNPFFPQSAQVVTPIIRTNNVPDVIASAFVLNGITPSGPKRTAMINGRTFEAGESGEVKLPSGIKVMIKCEEIKNDAVIIVVDGQRRELRLRFGL